VFVLREVFDLPYEEIAEAVGKSPAAVRQTAHRAREHVAARRPRMSVDREEQEEALERFRGAVEEGDLQGLIDVLAPDVKLVSDGGGVAQATSRPISGPKTVARLLTGFAASAPDARVSTKWVNGSPALWIEGAGGFDTVVSLAIESGRITRIYSMRNPEKLGAVARRSAAPAPITLSRT
jgi:RNA polymerase sigma-70 factor (ECF subfamily)